MNGLGPIPMDSAPAGEDRAGPEWRAALAEAIAATLPAIGDEGAWLRGVLPELEILCAIERAATLIAHPSTAPARRWEALLDMRRRSDDLLRLCLVARSLLIATGPAGPDRG